MASPKYIQLKNALIKLFAEENYQANQALPTENELIDRYSVSRNTVRKTLDELLKIGLIYKKQGSGSYYSGTEGDDRENSLLIGVIVPRLSFYIYPLIIQGIDDVANEKGYNIVLGGADVNPDKEPECLERLLSKKIDGLIFEPSGGNIDFENSPIFRKIQKLDIPVVILDWAVNDASIPYVSPNDIEGGYKAAKLLIDEGHEKIAIICPSDTIPAQKRLQGYRQALQSAGLSIDKRYEKLGSVVQWAENGQINSENPHITLLVNELIQLGTQRPTAIIFYNDEEAFQGYTAIKQAGLKIPDDISVIGFDDTEYATMANPPLTSVVHPKYKLGKWAAKILLEKLASNGQSETVQMLLNPSITERDSVKTLK